MILQVFPIFNHSIILWINNLLNKKFKCLAYLAKQNKAWEEIGQSAVIYQYCSEQGQITMYGVNLEDYIGIKQVETIGINRFSLEVKEGFKHQSNDPETTFQLQQWQQIIFLRLNLVSSCEGLWQSIDTMSIVKHDSHN